jgi:hypothetical protein
MESTHLPISTSTKTEHRSATTGAVESPQASSLRSNKLVNTDAQGRPVAARPSPLGRGLHARYSSFMNYFLPLFAVVVSSSVSANEISVRPVQQGRYELVLTSQTVLTEPEAQAKIAKAASSACKGATAILGKWRFESNEAVGGVTASAPGQTIFRFVQEISCGAGAQMESANRMPILRGEEETQKVRNEVRARSEAYFKHIALKQVDEAFAQLTPTLRSTVNGARWKADKLSFQAAAGVQTQVSIAKVTVYDNPAGAPEPGLYVAADYSNSYREVPIHCGYLMWFRPVGGDFRITREETGYVTSEQIKSIPNEQLSEIRRKLRCPTL